MFPAPITQKVTRVLQALCQKLGAETKPGFLILSQRHMYQTEERRREGREEEGRKSSSPGPDCTKLSLEKREGEKKRRRENIQLKARKY